MAIATKLEKRFALVWRAVEGPDLACEHRFDAVRKWRFDFAHLETKTAIELEGGIWSGGAHTRGGHFKSDCEKYNAAALAGWTVFRLATGMVRVEIAEKIKRYIEGQQCPAPLPAIQVADMTVADIGGGKYWLQLRGAEGMETTAAKLAVALGKFFAKEF